MVRKLPPEANLADRMRARILTRMHLWGLAPGERLPGIRELARDTGEDHRAVAEAYRELAAEGLVEIRERSGVYVSDSRQLSARLDVSNLDWLAGVLAEARRRRIALPELHRMVSGVAGAGPLRCACVESNEDQMAAYCWELSESYGLDTVPVYVAPSAHAEGAADSLHDALARVDLAVTTAFHADLAAKVARQAGVPLVVLVLDAEAAQDVAEMLRRRLEVGSLSVVVADPLFIRRARELALSLGDLRHNLHFVLANNRRALAQLDPGESVIMTRAAQKMLGEHAPPVLMLHSPIFAPQTVQELCTHIARIRLGS